MTWTNIIACLIFGCVVASTSHALRCGGKLVGEGSDIQTVTNACKISGADVYIVDNANADIQRVKYTSGGMTHTMTVIDGVVRNIDSNREQ